MHWKLRGDGDRFTVTALILIHELHLSALSPVLLIEVLTIQLVEDQVVVPAVLTREQASLKSLLCRGILLPERIFLNFLKLFFLIFHNISNFYLIFPCSYCFFIIF